MRQTISILAVAILTVLPAAAQTAATWLGGPGNYSDAINWSTDPIVPANGGGSTYDVSVPGGSLTLDIDVALASFTLGTARLDVAGTKTITSAVTLGPGAIIGGGTLGLAGTAQAGSGVSDSYLNIDGGAAISNSGTFTHARLGAGETAIVLNADKAGGSSTFTNTASGTFVANAAAGDASVGYGAVDAGSQFVNAGTFTKTGAHDYAVNVALANSGAVQVQQAVLNLNAGDGGATSGAFNIDSGATLALSGSFKLVSGASVGGAGTLRLKSGSVEFAAGSQLTAGALEVQSGTAAFRAGSALGSTSLTMSGGVAEIDVDHTFTGARFGNGGTVTGVGAVTFAGTTEFGASNYVFGGTGKKAFSGTAIFTSGATSQYFNVDGGGAEVSNTGTFTQQRSGAGENAIILNADSGGGSSVFRNAAGGFFVANASGGDLSVGYAAATAGNQFINEGTFTKNGAGNYDFNVTLANSGTIAILQGTLRANVGGTASGAFTIVAGGTLGLNGAFTLGPGATVSGAGTLRVGGGVTTFQAGSTMNASALQVAGGMLAFSAGSNLGTASLSIAGGTLQLDIDHTFTAASFASGGGVTGAGNATFAGTTSFDGNSYVFGGTGLKAFSGTVSINSGATDQFFNINGGTTVSNTAAFTQTRAGTGQSALVLDADLAGGPSVFRNAGSGTFTAAMNSGSGSITAGAPSAGNLFANDGIFLKKGTGDYSVNVAFANTGSVTVQQGLLALNTGDGGATTGSFLVQSGASISVNGGFAFGSGTTVSGGGTFKAAGGSTVFASGSSFSAANLQIAAGTLTFRGGSALGSAALGLAGGTLELDIDHAFTNATFGDGATIAGAGAVSFGGTTALNALTLTVSGSGVKTFSGTTTFSPGATDEFLNLLGGASLTNTGTFTQTHNGAGASGIVLASDGIGSSTFRNAVGGTFNASVASGLASIGHGGNGASNQFINAGNLNKTGAGIYQVNVPMDNSGTVLVSQGTLSITSGMSNKAGTVLIDTGATLDLSENANASTTGSLTHNGVTLALGANDLTIAKDYQNAGFGSGNSFNARANVTGTAKILADAGTALAYGGDATSGAIQFGTVHVGDVVSARYDVQNTGTAGVSVRGAFQTTVGGASITDPRLSGAGLAAVNFGKLDQGMSTADRTVTFTASTAGALTGQQLHVATNFDNVTLPNLAIQGAANYYADPIWTNATGAATLIKVDASTYTLSFGTISAGAGTFTASLDLLNQLHDAIYQDALNGAFETAGVTHFNLSGFNGFSGDASGSSVSGFSVSIDPSSAGSYSDTLTLNPTSSNSSTTTNLGAIHLTLQAVVVPEPGVVGLLLAAGAGMTLRRACRRRTLLARCSGCGE